MNLKEGIEKLKALIDKFSEQKETIVSKFTEMKLSDGVTIISFDAPEMGQGVEVFVITEAGKLPMPDGEYTCEDGSVFTVSGGLVATHTPGEVIPEGETNAMPPASMTPQAGAMEQKTAPKRVIKSQVEEHVFSIELEDYEVIKVDLSPMFKAITAENIKLKEINKEMFSIVKELSESPATKPTEKVKETFNVIAHRKAFKEDFDNLAHKMQNEIQ